MVQLEMVLQHYYQILVISEQRLLARSRFMQHICKKVSLKGSHFGYIILISFFSYLSFCPLSYGFSSHKTSYLLQVVNDSVPTQTKRRGDQRRAAEEEPAAAEAQRQSELCLNDAMCVYTI